MPFDKCINSYYSVKRFTEQEDFELNTARRNTMDTVQTVSRWAQTLDTPEWDAYALATIDQMLTDGKTEMRRSIQGTQGPTEYVYTRTWLNEATANEWIAFIEGYTGATHISTVIEPITP